MANRMLSASDAIREQQEMMRDAIAFAQRKQMQGYQEQVNRAMDTPFERGYFSEGFDPLFDPGPRENLSAAPVSEPDRKLIPRLGVALADEEGDVSLAKEAEALLGYNVLRRKLKIPGKLGEVLACLDIEPLNTEAVEKYKREMVLWRKRELVIEREGAVQFGVRYRIDISWRRVELGQCKEEVPLFALRKAVQVKKACPEAILQVDELIEEQRLIDPFLVARLDDETYYLEVWKEPKFEETL
jgi:hypothetical protein